MNKKSRNSRKNNKLLVCIIGLIIIAIVTIIIVNVNKNKNKEYTLEEIGKYKYFRIYENERYGVIDENANILIEPIYDMINIPNPSKPVFICYSDYNEESKEYKTKVFNEKNEQILKDFELVLPIMCEESISNIPFEKSVLQYKEKDKYGLINFEGKKITKAIYESIESMTYREGTLKVEKKEKFGAININGKEIIKIDFDDIMADQYYTEENNYMNSGFVTQVKTEEGYRYGYVNKNGKEIIPAEYNEVTRITDILNDDNIYLLVSKNGKYGVLKNDKELLNISYEEIEYSKANELFVVQKNQKQGVISLEGNEILPAEYEYILCSENRITTTNGSVIETYNKNGEKQNSKYNEMEEVPNTSYVITTDKDDKFGVATKEGRPLIENKYQYIEYAFDNYFIATLDGKIGVIDQNKDTIIEFKYDIIQKIKDKNVLQAIKSKENLIEIYNNKIEKQVSIKNAVIYTHDNYIKIISEKEMEYIDNNGNKIANTELFKDNSLYAYSKDNKWGFAKKNGEIVVDTKYDMVTEFNEYGFAGVKKNDKWGVVNLKGEVIVEPTYTINWNEPEFIGKYYKDNFGYGFEYYTTEKTK